MLSKESYIEQTEDAVRRMFEVVFEYRELFKSSLSPVAVLRCSNEEDFVNPAFDLQNDNLLSYSSNILSALEWDSFEQYQRDIKLLLNVA
jgi:hypothetical protein